MFNIVVWKLHKDIRHRVDAPLKLKLDVKEPTEVRDDQDSLQPTERSKAMTQQIPKRKNIDTGKNRPNTAHCIRSK